MDGIGRTVNWQPNTLSITGAIVVCPIAFWLGADVIESVSRTNARGDVSWSTRARSREDMRLSVAGAAVRGGTAKCERATLGKGSTDGKNDPEGHRSCENSSHAIQVKWINNEKCFGVKRWRTW